MSIKVISLSRERCQGLDVGGTRKRAPAGASRGGVDDLHPAFSQLSYGRVTGTGVADHTRHFVQPYHGVGGDGAQFFRTGEAFRLKVGDG
jgi:hypothetical protein